MSATTDIAVVGAGIVGLSTAYAAVQQGLSVTVYDAAPPGSGQSTGQSRLFRHSHDDPRLVALAVEGRELWRVWEDEFGVQLVSEDGAVALGQAVPDRLRTLADFPGLPVRPIDADEVAERIPLLAPYEGPAMLDEAGGAIRARAAIGTLTEHLRDSVVADHVLSLRPTGSGTVEVRTGTGRHEHGHVLVCAGRGTPALARGAGVSIPVRHDATMRVTFAVSGTPPSRLATLQDGSGAFGESGVYASPYPGNDRYAVGVSAHVPAGEDGSLADPAQLAAITDRTADYVARALPGLDPVPVGYVHCWTTELPWAADGIAVWETPGVSFLAGHNLFKHAPALGGALVRSVLGDPLREDLRPESRLGDPGRRIDWRVAEGRTGHEAYATRHVTR
ncbi:MAG: FAD-binding oxidoreductase [Actinomycetota bacterium]|nr:FAD-binding oxidoreductase [Actinomycetota bacterium]